MSWLDIFSPIERNGICTSFKEGRKGGSSARNAGEKSRVSGGKVHRQAGKSGELPHGRMKARKSAAKKGGNGSGISRAVKG